ncbi:MAG: zinc ribbon domain-containing protein [Methanoregula sp.]|nr:zinc ribbon domain-containing protein [Methanoregula sp.]
MNYSLVKYMTKTCGKCGHAALDDQAQFCNRCGSAVPEEKKPGFPVCPGCGTVVSDELAQFCNRCGARIPKEPVLCNSCGTPAIDNQSRFCTRCGTTFEQKPVFRNTNCPSCGSPDPHGESVFCNRCGAPFNRQGVQAAHQPGQAPVIVTQRKPAGFVPALTVPDTDWEPWTDVPPAPGFSKTSEPPKPEQSAHRDQQIAVPEKRYAHLPLIADDMKKKGEPGERPQKAGSQKKGVLGFLKK